MTRDYVGAVAHERRHVVGWWCQLMMGDRRRLRGSSRYMLRFFEVFGVWFGWAGECRVHRSQEWFFESPSPILWGMLSGRLGVVPCADGVGIGSAPLLREHNWDD